MSMTRPGAEGPVREHAYNLLDKTGREGMTFPEILRQIDLDIASDDLESALRSLEARGRAVEVEDRWYAAGHTPYVVGIVEVLETGDALLRPGFREEAEVFIRRRNLKGALPGDLVLVRRMGRKARDTDWKLPEGSVVKILDQRIETLVGTLDTVADGRRWLVPFDPKLSLDLEVLEAEGIPDSHYVVVRVERGRHPTGTVVEDLGNPDAPGVDTKVVLRHYKIPEEFPRAVVEEADSYPPDPRPEDWEGREDLRDRVIITIDGVSARDFDDAVSIERIRDGVFRLGVHIADVAHYVQEGTPLDSEAYRRGTSVYYPERAIPMLPEGLSNGLCSLRPGVPRLTMSAFLDISRDGKILHRRFAQSVIRSARRMTYTEVRRILEEPQPGDAEEYGPVLMTLREMHLLMMILHHARLKRGSIDFDLPEGNVELGTDGTVVGVVPGERNVAHRIIEEFMLAANEAVAMELETRAVPALYRVHDAPSPDRLAELRELLRPLGIAFPANFDNLHPSALQGVLSQVTGSPAEPFISSIVLRTMQRALYSPECRGHYALASRYYCHFTSPIRRYPDLVVHRSLKAILHGQEAERMEIADRLPEMGEHTSFTERRAEQSERDLLQWKKVRFLADRIGDTFRGRITGVQPFGLFVQLEDLYVDGLVPIRTMADDYYVYESESHRLIGSNSRRTFQLADPVEVELTGVSLRHRGLDLKIVGMPESDVRPEWPRPKERGEERKRGRREEKEGPKERRRSRR
ncbi:MAG TPA: ribonuclease R [Thermoanaerobaculia bacterium]